MKMKMVTALFALSLSATASFAQTGASDGSRYGHGQVSINCLQNISIYSEYVKTNNFKDAYTPWKSVFNEAPIAQAGTYTNGAKILRWFIANEKDAAKQKQYFEELMKVTDLVILDFKEIDNEKHKKLTGCPNDNIVQMAKWLSDHGKDMWIRHVLVPDLSDFDEDLDKLNEFIKTLKNVEKVEVLPYHTLGKFKWENLGIKYTLEDTNPPSAERIDNANKRLCAGKYACKG